MVAPPLTPAPVDLADALAASKLDDAATTTTPASPPVALPPPVDSRPDGIPGVPTTDQAGALGSRTALPAVEGKPASFNLFKFIKDATGTNLFTLPLSMGFYLPLTEIQFRAEELEYTALLDEAAKKPKGSLERATLVAGFALSHYAATVRLDKPFLPMHGETFDIYLPERGVRVLAETVYTNFKENTINNAWVAHGRGWTLEADDNPVVKLAGPALDFHLNWRDEIVFADGERFAYRKPKSVLGGIVVGTMHLTHTGVIAIRSTAGIGVDLAFLPEPGMLSGLLRRGGPAPEKHAVRGVFLKEEGGAWSALDAATTPTLAGNWDKGLWSLPPGADPADPETPRTPIWTVVPRTGTQNRHDMADFALRLNELTPELDKVLPPTDSRRRPDMRALEAGRFDAAYAAKCALEAALMAKVKAVNATGKGVSPPARWFELRAPDAMTARVAGDNLRWRYKGGYWEARAAGAWGGVEGVDAAIFEAGEKAVAAAADKK